VALTLWRGRFPMEVMAGTKGKAPLPAFGCGRLLGLRVASLGEFDHRRASQLLPLLVS
jgi:hypothetical protein